MRPTDRRHDDRFVLIIAADGKRMLPNAIFRFESGREDAKYGKNFCAREKFWGKRVALTPQIRTTTFK